ncbi:AsmA-like C-terminal region-containing protein [Hydrogenophaga sp.]|uniref:AsmA-like C-terminal region-containing protein n=1 Tax=Hydrogenophaga sp. TaxID=1904254 RepID=UPI003D1411D8
MTPATRRRAFAAVALLALLVVGASVAIQLAVPSNEELARRVEREFEARLGQRLVVGEARWRLRGTPVIEVLDAHTEQPRDEAIRMRRLAIYPEPMPLLRKRLVIDRLEIEGAEVPRQALAAYRGKLQNADGASVVLRTLVFRDLTYTASSGVPVNYEGEIEFSEGDRLPRRAQLRRPDAKTPATLHATHDGRTSEGADIYRLELQAGGGTAHGRARLTTSGSGRMTLAGELAPRGVEIQALLESFNRRAFISGRASGDTTLRAEGDTVGELFRSLRTRSTLQVAGARLLRIDLDKAVKSLGEDRAGQTPLDSLSGVMVTQNTAQGLKTTFTEVQAVAGAYSATGKATLYRREIEAQGTLVVGGGVVDVPFAAHGPTREPTFEMAWGSIAGAVIGTAVLPGIGTLLGGKIGGAVSEPPRIPPARQRR